MCALALLFVATAALATDVSSQLKGSGDETQAFARFVADHREVALPGGFTVTISGFIPVPPDTTIAGPGTIHITARYAGLTLAERCTVRDVRFTCSPGFGHGGCVIAATTQPGVVRRMDARITGCRFEKLHGAALIANEVSHVVFESNQWENHSPTEKFYDAVAMNAVTLSQIRGNTILHPNQGILFHGGRHNVIANNYVENCLQGITCHTQAGHPAHWPHTLFAHNTITGNVIRRFREEGICYDNSMGETPAVKAAQNQVRCVATARAVEPCEGRLRLTFDEPANPGKAYAAGWADHYFVGVLTGRATATLVEVIASGVDGDAGWVEIARASTTQPPAVAKGDRVWIAAGCFFNTITGNTLDNAGMVSGMGNATAIGLWGAGWCNQIANNTITTRQYGITIGCVGLARPDSPQGPCAGNDISHNTISLSWPNDKPRPDDKSSAGIGCNRIGDGELLGGRLFLGNSITHNTLSWPAPRPISLIRDLGTLVAFNRFSDADAAIWLDNSTDVIIEGNRTAAGVPVSRTEQTGKCSLQGPP
ncbi:MAG: right-handed parallel beta-helix repeat-containing protein [Phycisphaerae bacterium]|nr:right-handed parallel beta-helix repeat-containing protein [Phycisphaerae bacterium]